jgi:hypothetical protein
MQLQCGTEIRVSVLGSVGCGRIIRPGGAPNDERRNGEDVLPGGDRRPRVEPILANVRGAARVLAIDGCAQECARKTLELAGFSGFEHLKLWEMGYKKGEAPVTPERVRAVADRGAAMLAG